MKSDYLKKLNLFKKAKREKWALPQFNFSSFFQYKAILEAAEEIKKPFILATSEGESRFLGLSLAVFLKKEAEKRIKVPIILNLDHGKSYEYLKEAIEAGFDMVHFDGSHLSFEENLKITKKLVKYAKKRGVIVEGEIEEIKGSSRVHKKRAKEIVKNFTIPKKAKEFVSKTKIDALAVSIGNVHGMYKGKIKLDLERLEKINSLLKNTFLVLHGGSGIEEKEIKKAIERGITKINVNTEIRLAWRKGTEKAFKRFPNEIAPYKLKDPIIEEIKKIIKEKFFIFYRL